MLFLGYPHRLAVAGFRLRAGGYAVAWSMSTILTAVLPHEEMLLDSWLTFIF